MPIGTTGAIVAASAVAAGAGAVASNKAAKAQSSAANAARTQEMQMFEQNRADLAPWRETGGNALAALNYEMGLGPLSPELAGQIYLRENPDLAMNEGIRENPLAHWSQYGEAAGRHDPTRPRSFFKASPGYNFMRQEAQTAVDRSAAARGMTMSGATIKASQGRAADLASLDYNNFMNRLAASSGVGQTATSQTAALGANAASNAGNALMAAGNARASGYNAIGGQVQNFMGNALTGAAYGGYLPYGEQR